VSGRLTFVNNSLSNYNTLINANWRGLLVFSDQIQNIMNYADKLNIQNIIYDLENLNPNTIIYQSP
jgi:hypothetical protein